MRSPMKEPSSKNKPETGNNRLPEDDLRQKGKNIVIERAWDLEPDDPSDTETENQDIIRKKIDKKNKKTLEREEEAEDPVPRHKKLPYVGIPDLNSHVKNVVENYDTVSFEEKRPVAYNHLGPIENIINNEPKIGKIHLNDLNIRATFMCTTEDDGIIPKGSIVLTDPVEQYLQGLDSTETPKEIYVSKESHALKTIYPVINKYGQVESLLDGGSQIVSMDSEVAKKLAIPWDPDITIQMQSANRTVERTLGLARNVPFNFGGITIYLQVHVIKDPAYKVLLGRPFDVLTGSVVVNSTDGGQTVTITDPNSGKRAMLPTFDRGKPPNLLKLQTEDEIKPTTEKNF